MVLLHLSVVKQIEFALFNYARAVRSLAGRSQHCVGLVDSTCHSSVLQQVKLVQQTNLLTLEKLSTGLTMYGSFLQRIGSSLVGSPIWNVLPTSDGSWNIEHSGEFHRLWSAMQFVFCRPSGPNEFSVESVNLPLLCRAVNCK